MSVSEKTPEEASTARKHQRRQWLTARRVVQTCAFLLFLSPLLVVGWGLFGTTEGGAEALTTPADLPFYGSLSSSMIGGVNLLDPFGVLELSAASKDFNPDWLLFALPVLLVYAILRGRVFCGWVCPVNFFLEGVDFCRQKLNLEVKERTVPRHAKIYVAVGVLVVSAIVGIPLFEAFSPISAINKGILLGSTVGLVTLAAIVVLELFWSHRVWCRALCPVGGFYEVLGRVGLFNVRMEHSKCTTCGICKTKCLTDPAILDPAIDGADKIVRAGDCMLCGACVDSCPTRALSVRCGLEHFKGVQKKKETPDPSPSGAEAAVE